MGLRHTTRAVLTTCEAGTIQCLPQCLCARGPGVKPWTCSALCTHAHMHANSCVAFCALSGCWDRPRALGWPCHQACLPLCRLEGCRDARTSAYTSSGTASGVLTPAVCAWQSGRRQCLSQHSRWMHMPRQAHSQGVWRECTGSRHVAHANSVKGAHRSESVSMRFGCAGALPVAVLAAPAALLAAPAAVHARRDSRGEDGLKKANPGPPAYLQATGLGAEPEYAPPAPLSSLRRTG